MMQRITKHKKQPVRMSVFNLARTRHIRALDITTFTRQLATLVTAGIPVVQAFAIVAESSKKTPTYSLIQSIAAVVKNGTPLFIALQKYPELFDSLYCSLIETGERSGTLDTLLERLATYREKQDRLTNKIKKALYYPLMVVSIAVLVTVLLLVKVVPIFQQLFEDSGVMLPLFTRIVLQVSQILQNYGCYMLVTLIMATITVIHHYKKNKRFQHRLQRIQLRLPIFGVIFQNTALTRFAKTLATTTKAGIPLSDALELVSRATGNIVYITALQTIKEGLLTGQRMAVMMQKTAVFPKFVIQMVNIGEESGALEAMLNKVATFYEDKVDSAIDGLTSLLEPIIMLILGIWVGGLVVAIYLPIFQMGSLF